MQVQQSVVIVTKVFMILILLQLITKHPDLQQKQLLPEALTLIKTRTSIAPI